MARLDLSEQERALIASLLPNKQRARRHSIRD